MVKKTFSTSEKILDFSDFSKGINYDDEKTINGEGACNGYNFNYFNGALTQGLGVKKFTIQTSGTVANEKEFDYSKPLEFYSFSSLSKKETIMLVLDASTYTLKRCYLKALSEEGYTSITQFAVRPITINYTYNYVNYLLFSAEGKFCVFDDSYNITTYNVSTENRIYDVVSHAGFVFVVKNTDIKRVVYYCNDLNPHNITANLSQMKTITIPSELGNIVKLVSYDDYLYIFCEYGIYRLVNYTGKKQITLEPVFNGTKIILRNTIVQAGTSLVFMSQDGVYTLNGLKVKKLDLKINRLFKTLTNEGAKAVYINGYYYVACAMEFGDGFNIGAQGNNYYPNDTVLCVDLDNERVLVNRGIVLHDLSMLMGYKTNLVLCVSYKLGTSSIRELNFTGEYATDHPVKKMWQTYYKDASLPSKTKICKKLFIKTATNITVKVGYDDKFKTIKVSGKTTLQEIPVNVKGKKFNLTIECETATALISEAKLLVGVYE